MLPFDRLIELADNWAARHPDVHIFAQTGGGKYIPKHFSFSEMVSPHEYRRHIQESDIVLSHVGMGTVLSASELNRPLVCMPRRKELGEVTSDHQTATAGWISKMRGIFLFEDAGELDKAIDTAYSSRKSFQSESTDRAQLVRFVHSFLTDAVSSK